MLVGTDSAGVRGVGVKQVFLAGVLFETESAGVLAAFERADEEDLGEFGPIVEVRGADVLVDLGQGGECNRGRGCAVQVRRLPCEA